jgi:hypothetical protein
MLVAKAHVCDPTTHARGRARPDLKLLSYLALLLCLVSYFSQSGRLQDDRPGANRRLIWLQTSHKVGSMLVAHVLNGMEENGFAALPFYSDTKQWQGFPRHTLVSVEEGLAVERGFFWMAYYYVGAEFQQRRLSRMNWRVIHVIRDPLEIIISAFLYHTKVARLHSELGVNQTYEPWLNETRVQCDLISKLASDLYKYPTSWLTFLTNVDRNTAFKAQFEVTAADTIEPMADFYLATHGSDSTLTIRFEWLVSNFEFTFRELVRFVGIDSHADAETALSWARRSQEETARGHKTPPEDKEALRTIVREDLVLCRRINFFRRLLKYSQQEDCVCKFGQGPG